MLSYKSKNNFDFPTAIQEDFEPSLCLNNDQFDISDLLKTKLTSDEINEKMTPSHDQMAFQQLHESKHHYEK